MVSNSALVVGVHVIAGRADERAALGRVQFGNLLEERIEMEMRQPGIEQGVETLDEADDFDFELIGARDRPVNGGVERRGVAACRQDADAFHGVLPVAAAPPVGSSIPPFAAEVLEDVGVEGRAPMALSLV
jgi:hypothetical protein